MITFIMHTYATLNPEDQRISEHDDDDTDSLGGKLGVEDQEDVSQTVSVGSVEVEEEEL